MKLYIYVESAFQSSRWFQQINKGLLSESANKKLTIRYITDDDLKHERLDAIYKDDYRLVIVICTSLILLDSVIPTFQRAGVHVVLVNNLLSNYNSNLSSVVFDYEEVTYESLQYLNSCGYSKIAFLGMNADSGTDSLKEQAFINFMRDSGSEGRVYYNRGDIYQCCLDFCEDIDKYSAVLCANEMVNIAFNLCLRESKKSIPKNTSVFTFGDRHLSRYMRTASIPNTSLIVIDYQEIGRQTVRIYKLLYNNPSLRAVQVKISTQVKIQNQNINITIQANPHKDPSPVHPKCPPAHIIYGDNLAAEIIRFENFFAVCDELDLKILISLRNNMTQAQISEQLYTSGGTVAYRLKKMMTMLGVKDRQELIHKMDLFFPENSLANIISSSFS